MPGLIGLVGTGSPTFSSEDGMAAINQATVLLTAEPSYRLRRIDAGPLASIVLMDPGVQARSAAVETYDDLGLTVAYYGEFYDDDFLQARTSREVARRLAERYEAEGERFAANLNGSFLLALYDRSQDSLLVANDHYASRPLHYASVPGRFCFAPELKALPSLAGTAFTLDESALVSFLGNGHLLGNQSWFQEVSPLRPSHFIHASRAGIRIEPYETWSFTADGRDEGRAVYTEELKNRLRKSVDVRLRNAGRIIVPISGGYDSRGILGFARQLSPGEILTVSWGVDEEAPDTDAWVGRRLAERVRTTHRFARRDPSKLPDDVEEMLWRIDALTDDACLHHGELRLMRSLRDETSATTLLRGDECFGYGGPAHTDQEILRRIAINELAYQPGAQILAEPRLREKWVELSRETSRAVLKECTDIDPTDCKDTLYFSQRLFHYLNRSTYYKLAALEVQNPWLDRRVLEFIRGVPRVHRLDKTLYRHTVHSAFPSFADIPYARHNSLENWPAVLAASPELRAFLEHHLIAEPGPLLEYFEAAAVRDLLAKAMRPVGRPTARQRVAASARRALARSGPLYRVLKAAMIERLPAQPIPAATLVFRLLSMKIWLQRSAELPGRSPSRR